MGRGKVSSARHCPVHIRKSDPGGELTLQRALLLICFGFILKGNATRSRSDQSRDRRSDHFGYVERTETVTKIH